MRNLWNAIVVFFTVTLPRMGKEELRGFRNSLVYLISALYAICIFQMIADNYIWSSVFGFALWVGSVVAIFKIRRIVNVAIVGEAAEATHITPVAKDEKKDEGAAAAVINPLNTNFWKISLQVFFFVTIAFLVVPLMPLRNNPLFVLLFPTMAVAIAIAFKGTALRVVNWISAAFIFVLFAVHFLGFFPQVSYYTGLERLTGSVVSAGVAKKANEVDRLRGQQRANALEKAYQKALDWQAANPGRDLPESLKKEIEAAKLGLTVSEYEAKLKANAGAGKPESATPTKAGARSSIDKVEGKNCWLVEYYPDQQPGWIGPSLAAGRYEITATGAVQYKFDGKQEKMNGKRQIILSADSSLAFYSDQKGGEMIRITIWRVG